MLHKRTSAVVPLPCGWSWLNVFLTNQGNFFVQTVVKPTIKSYAIQINALTVEVVYQYYFLKKFSAYKQMLYFSSSFCEYVIITVRIACLISGTVPEPTMCHVQFYSIYLRLRTLVMLLLRLLTTTKVTIPNITRGARMQNRHIVQQQGGVRTTYTMRAAAELSFVVRPMIDGLHYKLATIGTPSPKRARKKTSSIFQS